VSPDRAWLGAVAHFTAEARHPLRPSAYGVAPTASASWTAGRAPPTRRAHHVGQDERSHNASPRCARRRCCSSNVGAPAIVRRRPGDDATPEGRAERAASGPRLRAWVNGNGGPQPKRWP